MAEHEMQDMKQEEEAKHRKKSQPIYDQLKCTGEPENAQTGQTLTEPSMAEEALLISGPQLQGAQRAEAMLGLQQTYGNRYVQGLFSRGCPGGRASLSASYNSSPSLDGLAGQSQPGQRLTVQCDQESEPPSPETEEEGEQQATDIMWLLLDPNFVRPWLLDIPLNLTLPPMLAPATPTESAMPLVPRGAGPTTPRPATPGDILGAIMAVPAVDRVLNNLQTLAIERVEQSWSQLSTGGKIAVVTPLAVIAGSVLTGVLANRQSREFVFDQLNGRVVPVPGFTALGVEFNTEGDNLMFGLHLDVGALLPPWLRFGRASLTPIGAPPLQRQLASGEEQRQGHPYAVGPGVVTRIQNERGAGEPLEPGVRREMEVAFGQDFSQVRIHTDATADKLAKELGARAFTTGKDVFFKGGAYQPGSEGGKSLLSHELTHTLQQSKLNHASGILLGEPALGFELEANLVAQAIARGQDVHGLAICPTAGLAVQKAVVETAGLVLSAGSLAFSLAPSATGGLAYQNVTFSNSRSEAGPIQPPTREDRRVIVWLEAIKGLGVSWGFFQLVFDYDGYSILGARTEAGEIHGFEGGTLGSAGSLSFTVANYGRPSDDVLSVLLTFHGALNPTGPGYCEFTGSLIVKADGTIERRGGRITKGEARAGEEFYGYRFGWWD